MGLVARTENAYFERWRFSVMTLDQPGAPADSMPEIDRYRNAYDFVTKCLMSIIEVREKDA
jgi:hypothetical protein